jgi:hypothetical protein
MTEDQTTEPDNGDKWLSRFRVVIYVGFAAATVFYNVLGALSGDLVWYFRSGARFLSFTGPSAWLTVPATIAFWIALPLVRRDENQNQNPNRFIGYLLLGVFVVLLIAAYVMSGRG